MLCLIIGYCVSIFVIYIRLFIIIIYDSIIIVLLFFIFIHISTPTVLGVASHFQGVVLVTRTNPLNYASGYRSLQAVSNYNT